MDCLTGQDRNEAEQLLDSIHGDDRFEYLGTNEDRDFVTNCLKCRHVHWPSLWLDRLREIAEQLR